MATYTDLRNKIRESINVDYESRITTQNVKLFNEQNEYWGTFTGTIRAEDVNIIGGKLDNIDISKAVIVDSIFKTSDGTIINLQEITDDIGNISSVVFIDINNKLIHLTNNIYDLSGRIDFATNDLNQVISNLTDLSVNISAALSTEINERIESIEREKTTLLSLLNDERSSRISADTNEEIKRIRADSFERYVRQREDAALSTELVTTKNILSTDLLNHIERDKHFNITSINPNVCPYNLQDYTVNILHDESYPEVYFYLHDSNIKYPIAKMENCRYDEEKTTLTAFELQVFDTNVLAINSTLSTGKYYFEFNSVNDKTITLATGVNDYLMEFNRDTLTLTITSPIDTTAYKCVLNSNHVADLQNRVIDDNDTITSGVIHFHKNVYELSNFSEKDFRITNSELYEVFDKSAIEFDASASVLKLSDDISQRKYIQLRNTLDNNADISGRIYEDTTLLDLHENIISTCVVLTDGNSTDEFILSRDNLFRSTKYIENNDELNAYQIIYNQSTNTIDVISADVTYVYTYTNTSIANTIARYSLIPNNIFTDITATANFDTITLNIDIERENITEPLNIEETLINRTFILTKLNDTVFSATSSITDVITNTTINAEIICDLAKTDKQLTINAQRPGGDWTYYTEITIDMSKHTSEIINPIYKQYFVSTGIYTIESVEDIINDEPITIIERNLNFNNIEDTTKKYTVDITNEAFSTGEAYNVILETREHENYTYFTLPSRDSVCSNNVDFSRTFIVRGRFIDTNLDPNERRIVHLKFIDVDDTSEDNIETKFFYINREIDHADVFTNTYFTLKFTEISPFKYIIEDLDYTSFAEHDKYLFNENKDRIDEINSINRNLAEFREDYTSTIEILNNNINYLSSSHDNLSNVVSMLSINLSNDIVSLSTALSNDIDTLSANLSNDIISLSTSLSTDIDTLSANLSNVISTNIYNIDEISTDINNHYRTMFKLDRELCAQHDISVDNLIIVDEERPNEISNYITFKYGTLVLVQI